MTKKQSVVALPIQFFIFLTAFIVSNNLQAYELFDCTGTNEHLAPISTSLTFEYRSSDIGSLEITAIQAASSAISGNTSPGVNINASITSGGVGVLGDSRNSITKNETLWGMYGTGAAAIALISGESGTLCFISDTDIVLNPSFTFNTSLTINPTSTAITKSLYIRTAHELTHGFGLSLGQGDHENSILSLMNEFFPHGGVIGNQEQVRLLPDDLAGLRDLHGESGSAIDVMSSSYKLSGSNSGKAVLISLVNTTTAQGLKVSTSYTVGNRGSQNASLVSVKFYFSLNDWINPGFDVYSGTEKFVELDAGETVTNTVAVDVPPNINPANYYIGYVATVVGTDVDASNDAVPLYQQLVNVLAAPSSPAPAPPCAKSFVGCWLNKPNWFINVSPIPGYPMPILGLVYESSYNGSTWDPYTPSTECNVWTGQHSLQYITTSGYGSWLRVAVQTAQGTGAFCQLFLLKSCGQGGGGPPMQ